MSGQYRRACCAGWWGKRCAGWDWKRTCLRLTMRQSGIWRSLKCRRAAWIFRRDTGCAGNTANWWSAGRGSPRILRSGCGRTGFLQKNSTESWKKPWRGADTPFLITTGCRRHWEKVSTGLCGSGPGSRGIISLSGAAGRRSRMYSWMIRCRRRRGTGFR